MYLHEYEGGEMNSSAADRDARINGLSIHYVAWGKESSPPILLVHGLRAYGLWFKSLAESLLHRYRVVALDLRGRNQSDWAPDGDYSTDAYVSDLAALADRLEISNFVLGGHSL